MIKAGWNGEPIWWCDECDIRTDERGMKLVQWTAGNAPAHCPQCAAKNIVCIAWDVATAVRNYFGHEPDWSVGLIVEVVAELKLTLGGLNPHRVAAVLCQMISRDDFRSAEISRESRGVAT